MQKYIILRLGWLIGDYRKSNKFVGQILNKIKTGENHFNAVNNIWGSLTFADDLAKLIEILIQKRIYGVFNFASKGYASRYDLLCKMVDFLGLQKNISIKGVNNNFFDLIAKRPKYEILKMDKIISSKIYPIETWQKRINEYLEKIK